MRLITIRIGSGRDAFFLAEGGGNDRSFRIRNDRIRRRLAGLWPARTPFLIRRGAEVRPPCATRFVSLQAARSLRQEPLRFETH